MRIALIVAMSTNGVIGRDNQLPWHLPEDLQYFKKVTMGKPIVMGRKTFESIGRPLPGRANIVVTRNTAWSHEGVQVAGSLDRALMLAQQEAKKANKDELMVIGGAQIYRDAIGRAHRLYVTQVHADVKGDAYFPSLQEGEWSEMSREDHGAQGANTYDYSFIIYNRAK